MMVRADESATVGPDGLVGPRDRSHESGSAEREVDCAMALAHLRGLTPVRQTALLQEWRPSQAWEALRSGDRDLHRVFAAGGARVTADDVRVWARQAQRCNVESLADRLRGLNITAVARGLEGYPPALLADPHPPGVLFVTGDPGALRRPMAAVVGTRRPTASGRAVARRLAEQISAAGITVSSGLALGIDGAAHEGSLAARNAPALAIVGCGVDVVYPRRHLHLWRQIGASGAIVSEYPPGTRPEPAHFPERNRLIAGLANVVVVVESHREGGSLITVRRAEERLRTVLVVPGPIGEPSCAGSNELLRIHPACLGVEDVAAAMNWSLAVRERFDHRREPSALGSQVLAAMGWEPRSTEWLVSRLALRPVQVIGALTELETDGWTHHESGRWRRLACAPG